MSQTPYYEMVPNVSEGRDEKLLDIFAEAITDAGARLIHRTNDSAHHRSVFTVVGDGPAIVAAAVALAGAVSERVDMRFHHGEHPRMGALDVLPFIPLRGATMDGAVALARSAAQQIWDRHRIPSFYYGEAALMPQRRLLPDVRKGEFEGLTERFKHADGKPDVGEIAMHETAGAIAVGARPPLIAFNVDLHGDNISVAKRIARRLRERDGGLPTLRGLGIDLGAGRSQVSFNVTDSNVTPLSRVAELVRAEAAVAGVTVARCELIGLAPRAALAQAASWYLGIDE